MAGSLAMILPTSMPLLCSGVRCIEPLGDGRKNEIAVAAVSMARLLQNVLLHSYASDVVDEDARWNLMASTSLALNELTHFILDLTY